jgi:plastocyanin
MLKKVLLSLAFATISLSAFADEIKIVQKEKTFLKDGSDAVTTLNVKVGDKIVFVNQDNVTHNVYSKDGGNAFEIAKQEPGQEKAIEFKEAGTAKIRCAIHPKMKVEVKVE